MLMKCSEEGGGWGKKGQACIWKYTDSIMNISLLCSKSRSLRRYAMVAKETILYGRGTETVLRIPRSKALDDVWGTPHAVDVFNSSRS